ncbi:chordin-like [Clavelina lepadiformis]|uniref:chordin-like n=1 Tax=Clavelina lepadiformis TaxID=159417 RepID=UPI0040419633
MTKMIRFLFLIMMSMFVAEGQPMNSLPRTCRFGGESHVIGSSWHPNLGRPFGVMYCVTCHCVRATDGLQTARGRRRQPTKVTCHDVRKHCPPARCVGARTPRGECCKVCPEGSRPGSSLTGEHFPPNLRHYDVENVANDDSRKTTSVDGKTKHFLSLLTSGDDGPLVRVTFTLQRIDLHFIISPSHAPPHLLELMMNNRSKSLYRHPIQLRHQSEKTTICAVWKNLPKYVVNLLEKNSLIVRLSFNTSSDVLNQHIVTSSGRIRRHRALGRETFSSILSLKSSPQDGSAGAVVMVTLGRHRFNKLHFVLIFKSEFPIHDASENDVMTLRLLNEKKEVLKSSDKKFVQQNDEITDVWSTDSKILRHLGAGSLKLELVIKTGVVTSYVGNITTRTMCGGLEAVLSGSGCVQPASTGAAGSAIFTIKPDSSVKFKVNLVGLSSTLTSLAIFGDFRKKRSRVIDDVTSHYKAGIAEGTLPKLGGRELHLLMSGRVRVAVETEQSSSGELSGHLRPSFHQAMLEEQPMLLAGALMRPPVFTEAAGHAWFNLDDKCRFYYVITLSGLSKESDVSLSALLRSLADGGGGRRLKGFHGSEARGVFRELSSVTYDLLNKGTAYVQITTKRHPTGEIGGSVHIPNSCSSSHFYQDVSDDEEEDIPPTRSSHPRHRVAHDAAHRQIMHRRLELHPLSCFAEGRWWPAGSTWAPSYDRKCTTCVCEGGGVLCDPILCPRLACQRPVALDTECCPVCSDGFGGVPTKEGGDLSLGSLLGASFNKYDVIGFGTNKPLKNVKEGCQDGNGGEIRPFGSSWKPFFPQFGFVPCVNCTCRHNGEIVCGKITCPLSACDHPVKMNPTDCCETCPVHNLNLLKRTRDQGMQEDSAVRMCEFGGDLKRPGESWHPVIPGLENMKCIECKCPVHGVKVRCERKCPPIEDDCHGGKRSSNSCCPWRCHSR